MKIKIKPTLQNFNGQSVYKCISSII